MAQYINTFNVDLATMNMPVILRQFVGEGNNNANKIVAKLFMNGEPQTAAGTCTGKVIRPDGNTVLLNGSTSGNEAYIILDGESCAYPGQIEISITLTNGEQVTTVLKAYGIVHRTTTSSVIPEGTPISIDEIIALLEDFDSGKYFNVDSTIITGDGTESAIADHDSVQVNTLYRLQLTTKMSWLPSDYPTNAEIYYLIDIEHEFSDDSAVTECILSYKMEPCWVRMKQPYGSFGNWVEITGDTYRPYSTIITGDGTQSDIASHSAVKRNTLYRLQLTTKMSWLPSDYPTSGKTYYLLDYVMPFTSGSSETEIIYDENMTPSWVRQKQPGGSFAAWAGVVGGRLQVICQPGTDTIQTAVATAMWVGHADVILMPGEHIITSINGNGMSIGNDVRIIGMAGSIIKCHSSADSQYFSVFYAGAGDFEMIGVNIDASRIRYCVHDDPPIEVAGTPARHVYRECNMYIDNTQNTLWPNHQCIGGGMGMHTQIVIENCVFDAASPDAQLGLVSYHNNGESGAEGLIFIKDCWFKKSAGTARFGWYGTSTKVTPCYVANCLLGTAPVIRAETAGSTVENMSLKAWGNEIAT